MSSEKNDRKPYVPLIITVDNVVMGNSLLTGSIVREASMGVEDWEETFTSGDGGSDGEILW
ncbi:MAG: hypothetical protein LBS52_03425 [Dysgonamonadaceae bacterium]|jgi:hypothetical protein|nr:hypothetical protein [Dysgonamonadaceae bacterium]